MLGGLCESIVPILDKNINRYFGITIYKNLIYLLCERQPLISVYDLSFNFIEYINLQNYHSDICYDSVEDCFWTISVSGEICKLSPLNFCEIDRKYILGTHSRITNIAFNKNNNLLALMSAKTTYFCNKDGVILKKTDNSPKEQNSSLCQTEDSLIKFSCFEDCNLSIMKYLYSDFTVENILCLPKDFVSKSCEFFSSDFGNEVYVLAYKNYFYPYILKYRLIDSCEDFCEISVI